MNAANDDFAHRPRAVDLAVLRQLDSVSVTTDTEPFSLRLAKLYLKTSEELVDKLKAAHAVADIDAVRFAAHTLKSSSAMIGGARLAGSLAELEGLARAGSLEGADRLADAIEREYRRVSDELVDYVHATEAGRPT